VLGELFWGCENNVRIISGVVGEEGGRGEEAGEWNLGAVMV
jgi:hypothetical protein